MISTPDMLHTVTLYTHIQVQHTIPLLSIHNIITIVSRCVLCVTYKRKKSIRDIKCECLLQVTLTL